MHKPNLLIGAVSTNYTPDDVKTWIKTSKWSNCDRVLLVYKTNDNEDVLTPYLRENEIDVIHPTFDFWGNEKHNFYANTALCNLTTSYELVHNIRFLHIWNFLNTTSYENVLITDVRDVYFNFDPFTQFVPNKLTATNERITYEQDGWNTEHLHYNLGIIGLDKLLNEYVYNVGVFGGSAELVKNMCADIYLLSSGKHKVADQTSFNYLIQTKYKNVTEFTDNVAAHLHVVSTGLTSFDFSKLSEYSIVHQYDRLPELKSLIEGL